MLRNILLTLLLVFPVSVFGFSDINNSWYKHAILELKDDKIISGYDDGSFGPDNTITRAEILKIILGSAEIEVDPEITESCFSDIDINTWYAKYVCYASQNNIALGFDDGTFRPNGEVTVLEALAFSSRALKLEFPDVPGEWYDKYISFAHENKIIPKYAYTIDSKARRGQSVELLLRAKQKSDNKTLGYDSQGCSVPRNLSGTNSLTVNGKTRSYILDLPNNYDSSKSYQLVLGLHGRTNSNAMVRDYMGLGGGRWQGVPTQNNIRAYPAGIGAGPYSWHQAENIDFIDAMLSEITDSLCVDRSDVHIVGHSLGAYFSNRLACERGDVISTMTAVAGPGYNVECRGPVASLILHNRADPLVPFRDGQNATDIRKTKNKCSGEPTTTNIAGLSCKSWTNCSDGNPVHFCTEYPTYGNAAHSWPTGGANGIYEFIGDIR